jgi:hypothetical protein
MSKAHLQAAGRPEGRLVFYSPHVAATTGDGMAARVGVAGGRVVVARPVGDKPMLIALPARHFRGVTLAHDGEQHVVRLVHEQAGLTLDIAAGESLAEAIEAHDGIAHDLALPVIPAEDEERPPNLDGIAAGGPLPRRSGPRLTRRPRFLKRRRVGESPAAHARIVAREIIARR